MEKHAEILPEIDKQLASQSDFLERICQTVLDNDVSNYPILILYQADESPAIGIKVFHGEHAHQWHIHLSTLEEFVTKQLISMDKLKGFKAVYTKNEAHFCVFQINHHTDEAHFIFVPKG